MFLYIENYFVKLLNYAVSVCANMKVKKSQNKVKKDQKKEMSSRRKLL